ncbi:MAG: T9SS type A sorting domain-containing protein [Bacteroidia bacterium]|nr:T9SS type A sorting domain-containing protein [Bacteroidia bacterium]
MKLLFPLLFLCTTLQAHNIVIVWSQMDTTKQYAAYNQTANVIANIGDTIYVDAVLTKYNNINGFMSLKTFAGIEIDTLSYTATDAHCILKYVCQSNASVRYYVEIDGVQDIVFYIKPNVPNALFTVAKEVIQLYPNPANNVLYVSNTQLSTIEIINNQGVTILVVNTATTPTPVDVSTLPQGVYYVCSNGITRKWIKQ